MASIECQCGEHMYTVTRTQLVGALLKIMERESDGTSTPSTDRATAEVFADDLLEHLGDGPGQAPERSTVGLRRGGV